MNKYFVTIDIPNKKTKKVTILAERLIIAESLVVTEHLDKLPDGTVAKLKGDGDTCTITKDKTKKHWNHDGYTFTS